MKKIISSTMTALLMFSGAIAIAQTEGTTDTSVTAETSVSANVETQKPAKPSLLQRIKTSIGVKKEAKENIQEVRAKATSDLKAIRVDNKAEIKERVEVKRVEVKDLKAKLASSSAEKREEREENKIERKEEVTKRLISHLVEKSIRKLQATIEREETIAGKIEARIEKIKAAGGNTTEASRLVAEAKVSFGKAKSSLEALKAMLSGVSATVDVSATSTVSSNTRLTVLANLRKAIGEVEKYLREGHNLLTKAVASLRNANPRLNATATTSATVETTQ